MGIFTEIIRAKREGARIGALREERRLDREQRERQLNFQRQKARKDQQKQAFQNDLKGIDYNLKMIDLDVSENMNKKAFSNVVGLLKRNSEYLGFDPSTIPEDLEFDPEKDKETSKKLQIMTQKVQKGEMNEVDWMLGLRDLVSTRTGKRAKGIEETGKELRKELFKDRDLTKFKLQAKAGGISEEQFVGEDPISQEQAETALEVGRKDERGFAPQRDLKYLPVGESKFQLMSVDKVSGKTIPVLKDGKPVIGTEKEVLIMEGKKAQSLIDPYETRFLSKLGESEGTRLTELKTTAVDSRQSLLILKKAEDLLNQGIYTGSAAKIRLTFNKLLQETGIKVGGRKAINTETYASMMGLQVGKVIRAFGAGTGLSDADREYAEGIAGGKITLTEGALRQLIGINRRLAQFNITEFNSQVNRAKTAFEERDYFQKVAFPGQGEVQQKQTKPFQGEPSESFEQRYESIKKESPNFTEEQIFQQLMDEDY